MQSIQKTCPRGTILAIASLLFVAFAIPAQAATLIAETAGSLENPPYALYGGNGISMSAIKVIDGTFSNMQVAIAVAPGYETQTIGWQWRTGASTWEDCKTQIKNSYQWGIQSVTAVADSNPLPLYNFVFTGSECNTTALASASLYSVSATNTVKSFNTTNYYYSKASGGDRYTKIYSGNPELLEINSTFLTTQTRFLDIDITGTSTVTIDAQYFIESSEINSTQSATNPTAVSFRYSLRPSTTFSGLAESIDNTVHGTSSASIDFNGFADGVYDLHVTFTNPGCTLGLSPCPFPDSYIYTEFEIVGGILDSVGTPEFYDGTVLPSLIYKECSITQIGNCISNAGVYLFFPSQDALNTFTTLADSLDDKFPFAYIFDTVELIDTLYTTTQTQSLDLTLPFADAGDITLISEEMLEDIPMSSTINTLLTYTLWIMFMLQMYNRSRNVFNSSSV